MTRRFWWSLALTVPILAFMVVGDAARAAAAARRCRRRALTWIELALATPVVLWGGWPFFVRGWASVVNRHLNMFTLIALGVGAAYGYSVVATLAPGLFPAVVPHARRSGRRLLRAGGGDRHARAARPGARAARAQPDQRGDQGAARPRAEDGAPRRCRDGSETRTCRSSTCTSAIGCACGPARRCRSTASWSRARAPSTSRWSPASRSRSRRRRAAAVTGGTVNGTGSVRDATPSASAATRCWRRSSAWSARRSGRARRSSAWPTPSPAGSCRR